MADDPRPRVVDGEGGHKSPGHQTAGSVASDDGSGALSGLQVVDATQMLAGPLAGMRLGDLGADVVKVEPPGRGEFNRTHGFEDLRVGGEMTTFLALNRNKRSLALDLKTSAGQAVIRRLVTSADVFIQNFRAGTAERLGVGAQDLLALNPRLIYCSITGYGLAGPYRDRPGQDLIVQGYSGAMFSVGTSADPPLPGALWAADVMTGYQAVIAILAALQARERTGVGQHVAVDMLSTVLDAQLQELVTYLNTGRKPKRTAEFSAHAFIPAPYGVYRTADGWLTLAMTELPRLGEVLDDAYLKGLGEYNDGIRHRDRVYQRVRHAFEAEPTAVWISRCEAAGVWAGPVYDYDDLASDPHVAATGEFAEQPGGTQGTVRTVKPPLSLSRTPATIRRGAPRLGEHSEEILKELGYSAEDIGSLEKDGVVENSKSWEGGHE